MLRFGALVLLILAATGEAVPGAAHGGTTFLVRLVEIEVTLKPIAGPVMVNNCVIVAPDGGAHLELRRQEFYDGRASLVTYKTVLNRDAVANLRRILDADQIRTLPPFVSVFPANFDPMHSVTAEIQRGSGVQMVGYVEGGGEGPVNATEVRQNWLRSADAMRSLVEWFHAAKSLRGHDWNKVPNRSNGVCGK